jgi:aspartyl-tRNA(Asn)/glutamyl-tRNA(Gln) amidotransferase subunit B
MPGSKPVINREAIDYGIKVALALNCKLPGETFFSRKSYFYPDMSKNFQITQFEIPLAKAGFLDLGSKRIRITRINLEEDPARIVHIGSITEAKYVLVDYNRSGTPLCEIVTDPDITSPKEARIFLQELSTILQYLNIFDPEIEGSMRVDSNISLGKTRVEIKNISGFKDVERGLNYEIIRQKNLLDRGKEIVRETRAWDALAGVTRSLRVKEEEEDYGYIFEPDLPRISIEKKKVSEIKKSLPEFASQKIARYKKEFSITADLSYPITTDLGLANCFEQVAKKIDPKLAARFFAKELLKTLNYNKLRISDTNIKPKHLIDLLNLINEKVITDRTGEMLLREMIKKQPDEVLRAKGVSRIFDEKSLRPIVKEVLDENPNVIIDYKKGKEEAFHFLVGQVMRKTRGRGDPDKIRKLLRRKL